MQNAASDRWTRVRRALQTLGLVIGGLLLLQQVVNAVRAVVLSEVHLQHPEYLAAAIGMSTLAGGVQIIGWVLIMRRAGVRLSWLEAVRGYNLSFLPRYIPGSVWGYLSRSEWLWRYHQVAYTVSNAGSVLEVFFILLAGGIFSLAFGLPLLNINIGVVWLAGACLALIGIAFLVINKVPALLSPLEGPLANLLGAFPQITLIEFMVIFAIYVALWLCHGTMLFFLTESFGYTVASILRYVVIYYVAWSVGFLVLFVPAGVGIRDTLLSRLLGSLVPLQLSQATVLSVMARLSGLIGEIIWLSVSLFIARRTDFSRKEGTNTQ